MRLINAKPLRLRLSWATLSLATRRFEERGTSCAGGPQVVLLIGGPSSNKPSLAHEIHSKGVRGDKPFMSLPCAAQPTGARFNSLMFGSLPGFSAESPRSSGVLQSIRGGTLFLDDVDLLAGTSQRDLFAALNARQVVPLGTSEAVAIDVHTLASVDAYLTDRDSDECILIRVPACMFAVYLTELRVLGSGRDARVVSAQS